MRVRQQVAKAKPESGSDDDEAPKDEAVERGEARAQVRLEEILFVRTVYYICTSF